MKNLIIVVLLAAVFLSPTAALAQTPTQEEVNQQLLTLINDLMKQVQELLAKLVAMESTQAAQSQTLGAVQSAVSVLNPNTQSTHVPVPEVTIGAPYGCEDKYPSSTEDVFTVKVPISISGGSWSNGIVSVDENNSGIGFGTSRSTHIKVLDGQGTTTVRVKLDGTEVYSHILLVGKICQ